MDYLVDSNHNLEIMVICSEFCLLHRVVIGHLNDVHRATISLNVLQHLRIGYDIVDAVPVVLQGLLVKLWIKGYVPVNLCMRIRGPISYPLTTRHAQIQVKVAIND